MIKAYQTHNREIFEQIRNTKNEIADLKACVLRDTHDLHHIKIRIDLARQGSSHEFIPTMVKIQSFIQYRLDRDSDNLRLAELDLEILNRRVFTT